MRKTASGVIVPDEEILFRWRPVWTVEKFHDCKSDVAYQRDIRRGRKADEILTVPGNVLLNAGINALLKLLATTGPTQYNAANALICVGNGNTAESASQTDLQGASKVRVAMDATYPSVSSQTCTWKGTFGTSSANFNWLEAGVQNGAGTPDGATVIMLNRKQQDFGTKVAGATWTMTLSGTIS